jgi:hypothetical protein
MDGVSEPDKKFLHQYMTLTRCDLFFADKAVLVEGLSERLLLPIVIEKLEATEPDSPKLSSQYVTTIEVGGAYQDTNSEWVEAIKRLFLSDPGGPLFGFFGDHWQKIYGDGCGRLEYESVTEIGKEANLRSVKTIVDCLNRMRSELRQEVKDPDSAGHVIVFHTNDWTGQRRTGGHWGGDHPADVGHQTLEHVKEVLVQQGWDLAPGCTKILMLTHRLLANEQGYASLPTVFRYNDAFTKKDHPHIAYLVDQLEPACDAFASNRFGTMFEALGGATPLLRSHADKAAWHNAMNQPPGTPRGRYRGRCDRSPPCPTLRISDERDRSFRDGDRRFRQRDRRFRERDRVDRKAGLALRMTSTMRAMLAGFGRRDHARAPDEHAHDQGRFTT